MNGVSRSLVLFGGLIAGMVIHIFEYFLHTLVLDDEWAALMKTIKHPTAGHPEFAVLLLGSFAVGEAAVWLYAAVRPRFRSRVKAVTAAALVIWIPGHCVALLAALAGGILPAGSVFPMMGVGLVELWVGIAAGSGVCQERAPAASSPHFAVKEGGAA